jgi:hypothetical protein
LPVTEHMLLSKINHDMTLHPVLRCNPYALAVAHDPARIQGGNWKMQGFRRSGHVHDAAECEMSIAEFLVEAQERNDISD